MMNAESLISERVICIGMVRPDAAARGCGEVKDGLVDKYVFRGLAYSLSDLPHSRAALFPPT